MDAFLESFLLLFVLLNPFILSVYLRNLVEELDFRVFAQHVIRAGATTALVYVAFAWAGNAIFEDVLQIRFSSFLVFGGITFLIIGTRLILGGPPPVQDIRADSDNISASIAMPLLVGPGTISACVLAGSRLDPLGSALAVAGALALGVATLLIFKAVHDYVRTRNEPMVRRYTEIAGRATALFTGSFAVEMIFQGIGGWIQILGGNGG